MKKILLPLVFSSFLFACSEETKTEYITPPSPTPEPFVEVFNNTSVLKENNNTQFAVYIHNADTSKGYKSEITVNGNDTRDSFIIQEGSYLGGYLFILEPIKKETRVYDINVTTKDSTGNVAVDRNNILLGAVRQLTPTLAGTKAGSKDQMLLDGEKVSVISQAYSQEEKDTDAFIILTPHHYETQYTLSDNAFAETSFSVTTIIESWGFNGATDNMSIVDGFSVEDDYDTIIINGDTYKNCLKQKAINGACAIQLAFHNDVPAESTFTMNLLSNKDNKYLPTTINLKGILEPEPVVP